VMRGFLFDPKVSYFYFVMLHVGLSKISDGYWLLGGLIIAGTILVQGIIVPALADAAFMRPKS